VGGTTKMIPPSLPPSLFNSLGWRKILPTSFEGKSCP